MPQKKKLKPRLKDIIPPNATVEQLIKILPAKTHNCEPFGLMLMTTAPKGWSCTYYTHYSKKSDDRFRPCIANTPQGALKKMIAEFLRNDIGTALRVSKSTLKRIGSTIIPIKRRSN